MYFFKASLIDRSIDLSICAQTVLRVGVLAMALWWSWGNAGNGNRGLRMSINFD